MDYIDSKGNSAPKIVFLENVDELVTSRDSEVLDIVLSEFASRNYESKYWHCNSVDWALPQNRRRVFLCAVRVGLPVKSYAFSGDLSATGFFDLFTETFASARMRCPCLSRTLLSNEHALIAKFFDAWSQREVKGWDSNTLKTHQAFWQKHGSFLGQHQLDANTSASEWVKYLNSRDKDALLYHLVSHRDNAHSRFCGDVSQSIDRIPNSLAGPPDAGDIVVSQTMLPGGTNFVSEFNGREFHRTLHGAEVLALGGFPIFDPRYSSLISKYTSGNLTDLGGNMFAGTIIAALGTTAVHTMPWQYTPRTEARLQADETATAMALLESLM
jgi:site-specific DNA-cytosine methylase